MALLALPALAQEQALSAAAAPELRWNFDAWVVGLLAASAALYALGAGRVWRRAGRGRGITFGHAARFAVGWLALCAALLSPIDTLATRLFSLHMVQHELLMVVAAPLLVLSRPLEAWTWALKASWRKALAGVARIDLLRVAWRACSAPIGAWTLQAVALWTWHMPVLFDAALADEGVHIAQHSCFLVSALFFWWSVFRRGVASPILARRLAASLAFPVSRDAAARAGKQAISRAVFCSACPDSEHMPRRRAAPSRAARSVLMISSFGYGPDTQAAKLAVARNTT